MSAFEFRMTRKEGRLMEPISPNAALIVIDVQKAFEDPSWGERNNPDAEANIAKLLAAWRESSRPVFHVHHRSKSPAGLFRPELPGFKVKPEAEPVGNEPIIYKSVNSAFIGTDLKQRLRNSSIHSVIIVGLTTDHCVSTTTRMSGNFGFNTHLVSDATATFGRLGPYGEYHTAKQVHDTALASLNEEFAHILNTESVLHTLSSTRACHQFRRS